MLFRPGITTLVEEHPDWIENARVGLVSHHAAVDVSGASSAELLAGRIKGGLVAILAPEHGYFGAAGAGDPVRSGRHPALGIAIHSLYAARRAPSDSIMSKLDVLVFDLQDLGARCYTYVATLRAVLQAAAEKEKRVIVADRPIPLPQSVDGPVRDDCLECFVAPIRAPLSYGMTPGETALWIQKDMKLDLDLRIARMRGYRRQTRGPGWPPWVSPSPAILSWESACCYTATVFCEALPFVDCGRGTGQAFQLVGTPGMKSRQFIRMAAAANTPGVVFHPYPYRARVGPWAGKLLDGVRLTVVNPRRFRPVLTSLVILACLQKMHGPQRLWKYKGSRPDFFDKLMGSASVRESLMGGLCPQTIAEHWQPDLASFRTTRGPCLMYRSL